MTKWFDANYHYIVPELTADTVFKLDATRLLAPLREARSQGLPAKPVLIGPVTYLALGKAKDNSDKLALLPGLLATYAEVLAALAAEGVEWVQIDEPILVTELDSAWQDAVRTAYAVLSSSQVKLLLATYFGSLQDNLPLALSLPVGGLHLDAIHARDEVDAVLAQLPPDRVLSLGVINGRNIWKTDLNRVLDRLGAVLRFALRETADSVRRHQPSETDDGGVDPVRPVIDQQADERHVDGPGHPVELVLRAG